MKIVCDMNLEDFEAWSGAVDTKEKIMEEGKDREFEDMIEELYPDGLSDTELNDILWFEEDWIYESLGISDEDEEDDDDDYYEEEE